LEEDIFILEKHLEIGNKWSAINKKMEGRTENNIKNRFNTLSSSFKRKLQIENLEEASNFKQP